MLHVVGVWGVDAVFDFLCGLSPAREEIWTVSGARVDPAGVLHAADFAHDSSSGDCAADFGDAAAGVGGEIRQASADCAVDAAAVVLCVGDGSDHLFYGVPDLCAKVMEKQIPRFARDELTGKCRPGRRLKLVVVVLAEA